MHFPLSFNQLKHLHSEPEEAAIQHNLTPTATSLDAVEVDSTPLRTTAKDFDPICHKHQLPVLAPINTTKTTNADIMANAHSRIAVCGPQPRDPPNGRAPDTHPRPPKPVQPRDDGSNRTANACYGDPYQPQPGKPWPRDPGNGRQFALGPQPRDDGSHRTFSNSGGDKDKPPRDQKPPQPRDGGKKTRRVARDPNPRDPGV